jgi:ribosomal protein L24E
MTTEEKKPFYKRTWFIIIVIIWILGAIFGDKKSSSSRSSSSSSYSSSSYVKCDWCGKSFEKGTGYNTLMRLINEPELDYSRYCSRKCASYFLKNN